MTELIIVSGMSGAGKTQALKAFEDMGYYCVDNVLPQIIISLTNTLMTENLEEFKRVAVGVDIRGGEFFKGIYSILDLLKLQGIDYKVLYIDARDDVLINRYKETRRNHPLAVEGLISVGIDTERKITEGLKERADLVIDTSDITSKVLKQKIYANFAVEKKENSRVHVISFGFKRGIPVDCDYVVDCRFLLNPFNVEELRPLNGKDKPVSEYVFNQPLTKPFAKSIIQMLALITDDYTKEVKPTLVLGVGCTGGKHRSVAISEYIKKELDKAGISATIQHRDIYIE